MKKRIDNCKIINLFCDQSLDAGYILNILYSLDKLAEMKQKEQQLNGEFQDIEKVFIRSFWDEINKFDVESSPKQSKIHANIDADTILDGTKAYDLDSNFSDFSGNMDALLSMAFDSYSSIAKSNSLAAENSINCYEVYTRYAHDIFY